MQLRSLFVWFFPMVLALQTDGLAPYRPLNDGHNIPSLGLSTWSGFHKDGSRFLPRDGEVENAVLSAIDTGYRLIDMAGIFHVEHQAGVAINKKIEDGTVKREELFVSTKSWQNMRTREAVGSALHWSLRNLGLNYVDLYLVHWPPGSYENNTFNNSNFLDTWRGMVEMKDKGLARSIGVSEINQEQLEWFLSETEVKPAVVQVELNLNLQQSALVEYCLSQGIQVTSHEPFGSLLSDKATSKGPPPRVDDAELTGIAAKYNKTVPQVVLRYLWELGVTPHPKSVTQSDVEHNFQIFDFELTAEERDKLKAFDKDYHSVNKWWSNVPYRLNTYGLNYEFIVAIRGY